MVKIGKNDKSKMVAAPLTVGELLYRTRQKKGIDLLEAEAKTLIRAKYLEALEQSKFYQLPLPVYTYGFVQTYASYLGLGAKKVLSQFKEEYGLASRLSLSSLAYQSKLEKRSIVVTGKLLWSVLASVAVLCLVGYLGYQVLGFSGLPNLTIDYPPNQATLHSGSVTVRGSTDPGDSVVIGQQAIPVDGSGNFSAAVTLNPGVQTLMVEAVSLTGKTREVTRVVTVSQSSTISLNTMKGKND